MSGVIRENSMRSTKAPTYTNTITTPTPPPHQHHHHTTTQKAESGADPSDQSASLPLFRGEPCDETVDQCATKPTYDERLMRVGKGERRIPDKGTSLLLVIMDLENEYVGFSFYCKWEPVTKLPLI